MPLDGYPEEYLEEYSSEGLPDSNPIAERIYKEIRPVTLQDEENGWALLHFITAWTNAMVALENIVRDTDDGPGWSSVMNPATAPDLFLDWLGMFVGRKPIPNETFENKRAEIQGAVNLKRGSSSASRAVAKKYLTGSKFVVFSERNGSAWRYSVRTIGSETPNPAMVEAELLAQKPAGLLLDYDTFDLGDVTYADIDAAYATYAAILADPDYPTYETMLYELPG